MQEIELKFLVPKARLKGLMRQVKVKSSQNIHMAAHYFDTPKRDLAKADIGLRIRQEGEQWVQTIKAGGDGIAARLEHNTVLNNEEVQVMLSNNKLIPDLKVYKGTFIAPALADFKLKKLAKNLTRQYVTDVQRTTRLLEDDSGERISSVELAYDDGEIIGGHDDNKRQTIQEIEFELVSGELEFLFTTAKIWCKRYKLCLSTVTKAERGGLLLEEQSYSPAVTADLEQLTIHENSSEPDFIRAIVHNCLLQILPNSSAIAGGSENSEHIVQLYIGLRRLSAALNTFNQFSEQLNAEWQSSLEHTARLLRDDHERNTLTSHVEAMIQERGAPSVDWSAEYKQTHIKPIEAVWANDFQLTLLEIIKFAMSKPCYESKAEKLVINKLPKLLSKNHLKLIETLQFLKDNDGMDNHLTSSDPISDSVISTLDKTCRYLEDLTYISEFIAPLYSKKKSKRWLKSLIKAQESLINHYNNIQNQRRYQLKASSHTNALYGAGWFAAKSQHERKKCQKHLNKLEDTTIFW